VAHDSRPAATARGATIDTSGYADAVFSEPSRCWGLIYDGEGTPPVSTLWHAPRRIQAA